MINILEALRKPTLKPEDIEIEMPEVSDLLSIYDSYNSNSQFNEINEP